MVLKKMAIVQNKPVTRNMELRHLPVGELMKLSAILDKNEAWMTLMESIPRSMTDIQHSDSKPVQRKYSSDNIR